MGFFGSLFGGGKSTETAVEEKAVTVVSPVVAAGVKPEVIAAITAGVAIFIDTQAKSSDGHLPVVRIKRTNNLWAISGRNDLMAASQTCF